MVSYQCHHPFLPVKLRGQHPRVRLHADFCRGSRAITYPKTCNRRRLESGCRLFMVVHVAANIPELLSSRSLPVHHQYRNQPVNQHRSCRDGHTGLHLFQEKTPQQRHRGDARDHGRHYPIYPYPPGSHTTTGLHSRLPSSSGKLYTSHRGRENHYRQSQPNTSVRQKCGISGFTMFWGGTSVMLFLILIALVEHYFAKELMAVPFSMLYLPKLTEIFHPMTIIAACVTGFLLTSLSTYLYYATLQTATAETFMTFRAFQPMLTFGLEAWIAVYSIDLRPDLDTRDYILACIIILGSLLILIMPPKRVEENRSKQYMTD